MSAPFSGVIPMMAAMMTQAEAKRPHGTAEMAAFDDVVLWARKAMAEATPPDVMALRDLLTTIYVAVLPLIPMTCSAEPQRLASADWEALASTILAAAEGRAFDPLPLPWPPTAPSE